MKTLVAVISALFLSSAAYSFTLEVDKTRLIRIVKEVSGDIVADASRLVSMAEESDKPIYVLVNSPGGSVAAGEVFIRAINIAKHRGIEVKCISTVYAASMGFNILGNCSSVYTFKNTGLLYHPVRVGLLGIYKAKDLELLAKELQAIDEGLLKFLDNLLGMDKDLLYETYYQEKWWTAGELVKYIKPGWLYVINDIKGLDDLFEIPTR